jgi:hypothetical protein
MRGVKRAAGTCSQFRPIGALLIALSFFFTSSKALAQSAEANVAGQATPRSILDAVSQNQNELLAREVQSGTSGAGTVGVGAFASGRLKTSENDGLGIRDIVLLPGEPPGVKTFAYRTEEASAFANVVIAIPGTVLGGQLKFSGFVGHNWLSLNLKSNAVKVLDPNQSGSAENGSVIAGWTALWASQGTYALATIVGAWGQTKLVDSVGDCFPGGCNVNRYTYNTTGLIGNFTAGRVVALSASPSGPMLDLRGSVGYTWNDGDRFLNVNGDEFQVKFSTWSGKVAATLFANWALPNSAVLRPFVQGYIRQDWAYHHELAFTQSGTGDRSLTAYDQGHTYPGLDAGLTYAFQNMTLGSAVYVEGSSNERTLGGRVSASWKLN